MATPIINLQDKINKKIDQQNPRPKWQYQLLDVGRILLFTTLITCSILGLSSFLTDIFEFSEAVNKPIFLVPQLLGNIVFEFVIFTALSIIIVVSVYRQTDWPLVRNKALLIAALGAIIVIPSLVLSITKGTDFLPEISYRLNRREQIQDYLIKNGIFVGKITNIIPLPYNLQTGGAWQVTVENQQSKQVFISTINVQKFINQPIRIEFSMDDNKQLLINNITPAIRQKNSMMNNKQQTNQPMLTR